MSYNCKIIHFTHFVSLSFSSSDCIKYRYNCRRSQLREPLIKSYDPTWKIQKSVILFCVFLRISLPTSHFTVLANVCEKGNTRKTSWKLLRMALWGLSTLIAGIPGHCPAVPRPCIKFHPPFSSSHVPLLILHECEHAKYGL